MVLALGAGASNASAAVTFDGSPGTGPPPPTLGPYTMTPFSPDPNPNGPTTTAPGPTGNVSFDQAVRHTQVGVGWGTWSHGYTGDVYHTAFSTNPNAVTMTLPPGTGAFYFYAEPNYSVGSFVITATSSDGTTSGPISVAGAAGAKYFGFFATGSDTLSSIAVVADPGASGFAVGEFGIAEAPKGPPCQGVPSTIFGGSGSQTLNGTPGPDVIQAASGNDTINGGGGDDLLCGDSGRDNVNGEGGNDRLFGDSGQDALNGGPHSSNPPGDHCDGGTGSDTATQCESTNSVP